MKKPSKKPSKNKNKETVKNEDLKNISGGRRDQDSDWGLPQHPPFPGGDLPWLDKK
ncbi:hypothetical protein [Legionella cardiaca]|uniref:Uncharacterized protein n=1 Tax=Legionella cardiaca TaxID=1071983 RepID=A0ABY8AT64_9GAMM|nr:hypothetical protein [Legionella cardiaca]WED42700.1 hypothetical protein PXX05_12455 [Legionella cardiaca]